MEQLAPGSTAGDFRSQDWNPDLVAEPSASFSALPKGWNGAPHTIPVLLLGAFIPSPPLLPLALTRRRKHAPLSTQMMLNLIETLKVIVLNT